MSNFVRNTSNVDRADVFLALAVGAESGAESFVLGQEATGQRQLADSTVLPSRMGDRSEYEAIGFKFGEPVDGDPLFVRAELPAGWKKAPTDHSMWTDIVDDKGRKRGSIFYKAAFYDRDAFMSLLGRYRVERKYSEKNNELAETSIVDAADGAVLMRWDGDADSAAGKWLDEHRPDHRDLVASWSNA